MRPAKQAEAAAAAKAGRDQKAAEAAAAAQPPRTEKVAGRGQWSEGGYLTAIAGARRHVLNTVERPGLDSSRAALSSHRRPASQGS